MVGVGFVGDVVGVEEDVYVIDVYQVVGGGIGVDEIVWDVVWVWLQCCVVVV